jgi:hypothetical protein
VYERNSCRTRGKERLLPDEEELPQRLRVSRNTERTNQAQPDLTNLLRLFSKETTFENVEGHGMASKNGIPPAHG